MKIEYCSWPLSGPKWSELEPSICQDSSLSVMVLKMEVPVWLLSHVSFLLATCSGTELTDPCAPTVAAADPNTKVDLVKLPVIYSPVTP